MCLWRSRKISPVRRLWSVKQESPCFSYGECQIGVLLRKFYKSAFLAFGKSGAKIAVATTHRAAALMRGEDRCHCPNKAADPAVSPARGKDGLKGGFSFFFNAVSPARGEDPSRNAIRFPVTEVPVSTTVALYNRVLRGLHGRMSSGPPQPYFVEILRRGGNTVAGGNVVI